MSETKTKNLCTVPAADLTDSQYFIAEDGGELKRIPKAQVVLKKLENMLATDTENLAGGGEVTAQELLDVLAEQVANKLLAKSQVVNNLLATVEGNPLDATQGKALKDLIDTTNNNLSNRNPPYAEKTSGAPYGLPNFSYVLGSADNKKGTASGDVYYIAVNSKGRLYGGAQVNNATDITWEETATKDDLGVFLTTYGTKAAVYRDIHI